MSRMRTQQSRCDKSWHLGNKFLKISKFSPGHGAHYFTWPASPRVCTHPHAHWRVLSCLARQIACHGVNPLSWQCEACLTVVKQSCNDTTDLTVLALVRVLQFSVSTLRIYFTFSIFKVIFFILWEWNFMFNLEAEEFSFVGRLHCC